MYDRKTTRKRPQIQGKRERISKHIQHRKYNALGIQSCSKTTQKEKADSMKSNYQ